VAGAAWSQGVEAEYLRGLLGYWADGFDWRAAEGELNRYHHRVADVDGTRIHFVHHRGGENSGGDRIPLILTHGWPSTFAEMLGLVDRLGDRFDLVVPSGCAGCRYRGVLRRIAVGGGDGPTAGPASVR
jgi:hypothetical protein